VVLGEVMYVTYVESTVAGAPRGRCPQLCMPKPQSDAAAFLGALLLGFSDSQGPCSRELCHCSVRGLGWGRQSHGMTTGLSWAQGHSPHPRPP
jgi:hypothetical protein